MQLGRGDASGATCRETLEVSKYGREMKVYFNTQQGEI